MVVYGWLFSGTMCVYMVAGDARLCTLFYYPLGIGPKFMPVDHGSSSIQVSHSSAHN